MMRMRRGTKIGWVLVAVSVIFAGWLLASGFTSDAEAKIVTISNSSPSVASSEYEGDTEVTTVTSESGTSSASIGSSAFKGCTSLSSVTIIGSSDVSIGSSAFEGCTALSEVNIMGPVSISPSAFSGCTSLDTVIITGNATIDAGAFEDCTSLSCFTVGGNASLGSGAFTGCGSFEFSANGISSATTASFSNSNVSEIVLSGDGGTYYISDGALYEGTVLIYVPSTTASITIPDGTTEISAGALSDSNVSTMTFASPTKITNIGSQGGSWPTFSQGYVLTVYAYGGSGSAVDTYFTTTFPDKIASKQVILLFEEGGSGGGAGGGGADTYAITVDEYFMDTDGTTPLVQSGVDNPRVNTTLSSTYASGSTVTAATYDGFTLISNNSPYTVSANAEIAFIYKANASGAVIPGSSGGSSGGGSAAKKIYTVTVMDCFYKTDGTTKYSTSTRCTDKYYEGESFSYAPYEYANYKYFDGTSASGSVSGDRTVIFKYKALSDKDLSPRLGKLNESTTTTDSKAVFGKPIVYTISQGANQTVAPTAGIVSMTCDGAFSKFLYVMMDGTVVDKSNYAVAEGSTILAFTADYISKLGGGKHHIRMVYTDGYADTTLTITGKATTTVTYTVSSNGTVSKGHAKDSTPQTADGFDERYLLCMAILLCGIGFIVYSKQRKLEILTSGRDD